MKELKLFPQADVDLQEIWNTLAEESLENANRFNVDVDTTIQRLLEFPGIGHEHFYVRRERFLCYLVWSWLIIYRYDDTFVTVVRVVHAHRNLKRALRGFR
jgi:plasmid stabilization system protein ParE